MTACYTERNRQVKGFVTPDETKSLLVYGMLLRMEKRQIGRHYIREWRKKRGYSLRKLAGMMESSPGEELISYASLQRIENGEQPYNEEILNALAAALDVSAAMLIEHHPEREGKVIDLYSRLSERDKGRAIELLDTLLKTAS